MTHSTVLRRISGFTLLEIIIYIGLLSILLVGAWAALFQLMRSIDANGTELKRQEDIEFALAKIHWLGMGAGSITTASTSITFAKPDLGLDSPIVLGVSNGMLTVTRNNASPAELLPGHIVAPTQNTPIFQTDVGHSFILVQITVDNKDIRRKIFFP